MKNRHEAGVAVARQLRAAEHALDQALAESLTLGARMLEARKAAGFGVAMGHETLQQIIDGVNALYTVRGAMVSAHGELLDIASEHGVQWKLDGATEGKPVPKETRPTLGLRMVA